MDACRKVSNRMMCFGVAEDGPEQTRPNSGLRRHLIVQPAQEYIDSVLAVDKVAQNASLLCFSGRCSHFFRVRTCMCGVIFWCCLKVLEGEQTRVAKFTTASHWVLICDHETPVLRIGIIVISHEH